MKNKQEVSIKHYTIGHFNEKEYFLSMCNCRISDTTQDLRYLLEYADRHGYVVTNINEYSEVLRSQ